jgi:hypothetical protein
MAERYFNLKTNPSDSGTDTRKMGLELIDDLNKMKLIHDGLQTSYTQDVTDNLLEAQQYTKEPTGFTDPDNITVTYDSTARTITLTGAVECYYRGELVTALSSGYVSPPHSATTGQVYFLRYDGTSINWTTTPWMFYNVQIAVVIYNTAEKFAIRECHGLMGWQTHKEFHEALGTYRSSGGTMSGFTLSSTTAADRRPSVAAAVINDEDLATTNPALAAGTYSQLYLAGSGATATFTLATGDIVPLLTNRPYYNLNTSGTWSQALMTANSAMSIWLYAVPTTADAGSQAYRFLWLQGQWQTLATSASAAAVTAAVNAELQRNVNELNLGTFASIAPEYVCIGRVVIAYTGGNWTLRNVAIVTGTRATPVTVATGNWLSAVNTPFTPGGVLFADAAGAVDEDQLSFEYDVSTKTIIVDKGLGLNRPAIVSGSGVHTMGQDGLNSRSTLDSFAGNPIFTGRRANGTRAAPSAVASGNVLTRLSALAYGATAYSTAARNNIDIVATENWTDTEQGTRVSIQTTRLGGTTTAQDVEFREGYMGVTRGANVASATTITPTGAIFHVTGTTAVVTINIPYTGFNGTITIIPDGIFTWTTAGNIALAGTAVVSKALTMTYDSTTAKWYPSYV